MSNRLSTLPHKPGVPVAPRDAIPGAMITPPRWGFGRRALVTSLILLALMLAVVGYVAWGIVSALNDSQGSAVVPLPTRSSSVALERSTSTPTPEATSQPAPTRRATEAPAAQSSPGANKATTESLEETTPTSTVVSTPADEATAETGGAKPTATTKTATEQTQLATSGELSRLDILQQIVGASMQNGDPGRSSVWQGKTEINVLVLGVDRRPEGGDQNSDVIIIARVDLVGQKVSAVSLPRDLLVDAPGVYSGKINGAYNAGVAEDPDDKAAGVVKVRDTIETVYGIPIDGYVMIDFDGFEQVIDAVGGIDITVPDAIVDEAYPTADYGTERVEFKAGRQHMDGERALKYVRTRNTDSDDARRERQIDVLLALFDQGKGLDSIRRGDEIIVALSDTVQTSFGLEQQLTLARIARDMPRSAITLTTLEAPLIEGGYTEDGAWVYFSDPTAVAAFITETLESGSVPLPGS